MSDQDTLLLDHLRMTLAIGSNPSALRRVKAHFGTFSPLMTPGAASRELLSDLANERLKSAETLEEARRELHHLKETGCLYLPFDSNEYPEPLKAIPDPPPGIYLWGQLRPEDLNAVAIVGSRRASPFALNLARVLARELAQAGVTVVSGLARGIDAAAHEGALEAGGRTIAVLGSGICDIYPKEHQGLAERIAANGFLVSEFKLDAPPFKANFPQRNRVISGLSVGVLVVEAPDGSGALLTASAAVDQGRDVLACLGRSRDPNAKGSNRLIKDGAVPVETVEDIFHGIPRLLRRFMPTGNTGGSREPGTLDSEETALMPPLNPSPETSKAEPLKSKPKPKTGSVDALAEVTPQGRKILASLDFDPVHIDELIGKTCLSPKTLLAELSLLEISGLVKQLPGKHFQKSLR